MAAYLARTNRPSVSGVLHDRGRGHKSQVNETPPARSSPATTGWADSTWPPRIPKTPARREPLRIWPHSCHQKAAVLDLGLRRRRAG